MVFGRGPHHGRPSDVDLLDRLIPAHIRPGNGFPEGIEVHHHQIDQGNSLLLQIRLVRSITASGQDAAVHLWVQGLHPTTEDFRCTGVIRHPRDRESGLLEHFGRASTGQQLVTMGAVQRFRQRHQAVLVGHAQQRERCHGVEASWS